MPLLLFRNSINIKCTISPITPILHINALQSFRRPKSFYYQIQSFPWDIWIIVNYFSTFLTFLPQNFKSCYFNYVTPMYRLCAAFVTALKRVFKESV
jgi:hypothetical protein